MDLHLFNPKDIGDLVPEYIEACRRKGIFQVRFIHGKGQGILRDRVQALLRRHPDVLGFGHPADRSAWGATVATLRKAGSGNVDLPGSDSNLENDEEERRDF